MTTDSRDLPLDAPALFVARLGEQQDGHDHAAAAVADGAAAVLASRDLPDLPRVMVDDTDDALGRLARHVRDVVDPVVVGITGSVGKTTTKDLIKAACCGIAAAPRAPTAPTTTRSGSR